MKSRIPPKLKQQKQAILTGNDNVRVQFCLKLSIFSNICAVSDIRTNYCQFIYFGEIQISSKKCFITLTTNKHYNYRPYGIRINYSNFGCHHFHFGEEEECLVKYEMCLLLLSLLIICPIPGLFFVYFCPFIIAIIISKIQIEKRINGLLGIRTLGLRMVGADETMMLWRPPLHTIL